jgi:hypothetical protein
MKKIKIKIKMSNIELYSIHFGSSNYELQDFFLVWTNWFSFQNDAM